ncbi:histidine kinase [Prolixibacteraceae bacterium Z1-6]|uniref:Histidine kinase n=1 Tax=Draconibacterium aestuarii TaxID=2998507 RepID=A0A9X3FA53_9BACT|nr:histidine kinase [Prolixibacteraceae bacterium Z1-6]
MNLGKLHIDKKEMILHTIFWMAWVISFTFIQSLNEGIDACLVWLMYYIITLPIFITHTYLIAYWLLPKTFFTGRYILFGSAIILLLFIFSVLELLVSNYLVFGIFDKNRMFGPGYLNFQNILISGIGNHYIILVFIAIKAGGSWYRTEHQKEKLLRSKVETELEIFRYQLQPKVVYTLIDELEVVSTQQPDNAPEMIIKISNFLNGFLFESKEELIPLQLEVKLIKEFLEIHKHALGEKIISNFIVSGNLKPFVVPPLLLLPLINNAIKMMYECNKTFESTVIIKAEKKYLLFSFSLWSDYEFRLPDDENMKITKKRLKYNFPGKHRLVENIDSNFREFSLEIFT